MLQVARTIVCSSLRMVCNCSQHILVLLVDDVSTCVAERYPLQCTTLWSFIYILNDLISCQILWWNIFVTLTFLLY